MKDRIFRFNLFRSRNKYFRIIITAFVGNWVKLIQWLSTFSRFCVSVKPGLFMYVNVFSEQSEFLGIQNWSEEKWGEACFARTLAALITTGTMNGVKVSNGVFISQRSFLILFAFAINFITLHTPLHRNILTQEECIFKCCMHYSIC